MEPWYMISNPELSKHFELQETQSEIFVTLLIYKIYK